MHSAHNNTAGIIALLVVLFGGFGAGFFKDEDWQAQFSLLAATMAAIYAVAIFEKIFSPTGIQETCFGAGALLDFFFGVAMGVGLLKRMQ